jgi:hypothetical protein
MPDDMIQRHDDEGADNDDEAINGRMSDVDNDEERRGANQHY